MVSAPARRLQVAFAKKRGLSVRRACALLRTPRSGLGYASKRAVLDAPVTAKMRELSQRYLRISRPGERLDREDLNTWIAST
jgi:putative transposase